MLKWLWKLLCMLNGVTPPEEAEREERERREKAERLRRMSRERAERQMAERGGAGSTTGAPVGNEAGRQAGSRD